MAAGSSAKSLQFPLRSIPHCKPTPVTPADDKEKMEKALADALQGTPTLSVPVVSVGNNGEEVPFVVPVVMSAKLNDAEEVVGVVIEEEPDDG